MNVDIDGLDEVVGDVEEATLRLPAEIAFECERVLRRRNSDWPQDTGFSRDRFRAEDNHSGDVLIINTAPYAAAVNNRAAYKSGRRNPNYQAVQRTLSRFWDDITKRALRKALG